MISRSEEFNMPILNTGPTGSGSAGSWVPKEIRVVDPNTGGEKGSKLARFSLIPHDFLWALAEHYGKGEKKYAARNWEKGYRWGLTQDSIERHLTLFLQGERYDNHKPDCKPDCVEHTESHHLVACAWHCIALWYFDIHGKGTNDIAPNLPVLHTGPGRS
jgi:hypothetical protein